MSSPSPFLFSPPPLVETDTATSTASDYSYFDTFVPDNDDEAMLKLLGFSMHDANGLAAAFGGVSQEALAGVPVALANPKQYHPPALIEQHVNHKPVKPARQIPIPTITFTSQAFFIDPILALPTPVEDKYPILTLSTPTSAGEPPAYTLPPSMADPRLSLPTPTKDKHDLQLSALQHFDALDVAPGLVHPVWQAASGNPATAGRSESPVAALGLDLHMPGMSRSSSHSSSTTTIGSTTTITVPSPAQQSPPNAPGSSPDMPLANPDAHKARASHPPAHVHPSHAQYPFPTHLPLAYPARSGIPIFNARSQIVGWDCGPATLLLYEAKFGPPSAGGEGLGRDVQGDVVGGAPRAGVNWRVYGEGKLGAEKRETRAVRERGEMKQEPAEAELLTLLPGGGKERELAPRKSSTPNTSAPSRSASSSAPSAGTSRPKRPSKAEPTPQQAMEMWIHYYTALEQFKTLGLPSVMGPWEPECRNPFVQAQGVVEGGEE